MLGLCWEDVDLTDPADATITIAWQVDRNGERQPVKTEAGGRTVVLPRQLVAMLLEHKARSLHSRPGDFVFATRSGRPIGQRNMLRALRLAQTKARTPDGKPTFPVLHERDERDEPVPVVSWMLGHRDSTVTKQVYVHELQSEERRRRRRALLEERYGSALEAAERSRAQQTPEAPAGEVVDLRDVRDRAH